MLRIFDSKSSQINSKRLLHDAYKACIKLLRAYSCISLQSLTRLGAEDSRRYYASAAVIFL
jgi:hypothetical protein